MPLKEHIRELRNRFIIAALGILAGAVVGFVFYDQLFGLITEPVLEYGDAGGGRNTAIAFNTIGQPLDLMIRISIFVGIVVSSPVWLYQLWAFIMPGLKKTEKRYAIGFIAAAVPLFVGGVVLSYVVLPRAVQFLFSLNPEGTDNIIAPDVYFTFVLNFALAFGVAMIIPVVLVGVNMMGLITGKRVLKSWRGTVMFIAVVSALAAPGGEAMTMFFIMGPLTLLFVIAIGICLLNDRRREKRQRRREEENEALIRGAGR